MDIANKKVTVMGLGLHGGGVAVVKWLVKNGAKVTITDLRTEEELKPSIEKLKKLKVRWVLGEHVESDFKYAHFIVQNPGVPRDSHYLQVARKNKIAIENEASLFFKNCAGKIIGVTGTRGKSTTATLIHKLLHHSHLGGLPQMPMMDIVGKVKKNDVAVLELSSWQLEVLGEQKLSPDIAVVTNIFPDHLNRYDSMEEYIQAKKNIYLNQAGSGAVVLNKDNAETAKMAREIPGEIFLASKYYFSGFNGCFVKDEGIFFRREGKEMKLINVKDIHLAGEHNLENILAAMAAASIVKPNPIKSRFVIWRFTSLPGRLQKIATRKKITYVNDTTSTIPDATMVALRQFEEKKVVLIAGGDFKNIPDEIYKELAEAIRQKCKAVVLFSGQGSEQITKHLESDKLVTEVNTMINAVAIAKSFAEPGDTVLLSPACSSFNLFANEFDRGDRFVKAVKKLL